MTRSFQLWLHLASEHAMGADPEESASSLAECHEAEHRGPGTIRNHDPKDLSYDLGKVGAVLVELAEMRG